MFGHASQPTRMWQFGAKPPTHNDALVHAQMRAAHAYRNALVAQERTRRAAVDAALAECSPDLAQVERDLAEADQAVTDATAALTTAQAAARKRIRPAALTDPITAAKAKRRALYQRRKTLRAALYATPAWQERQAQIDAEDLAARKRLRAASGCYWGTYLHVENSLGRIRHGAPPRFQRWRGDGTLAVQCQGGLAVPDLLAGTDSRLRLEPDPQCRRRGRRRGTRYLLHIRVGSEGRRPIWATVPMVLNRPLPPDASIKWCYLKRRQVGVRHRGQWSVSFALARETEALWELAGRATQGAIGIDVGWRLSDRGLRVAVGVDAAGQQIEVWLDAEHVKMWSRADAIESHRDRDFNRVRAMLGRWVRRPSSTVPKWLREETTHLTHWRSQARLDALTERWRRGTPMTVVPPMLRALRRWCDRDRHLADYAAGLRRRFVAYRRDMYRKAARAIAQQYHTVVLEDLRMSLLHRRPLAEQEADPEATRHYIRHAAVAELLRYIGEAAPQVVTVDPAGTTIDCAACGTAADFDRARLIAPCETCGHLEDQDVRAARNILRRGRERPDGDGSHGERSPAQSPEGSALASAGTVTA